MTACTTVVIRASRIETMSEAMRCGDGVRFILVLLPQIDGAQLTSPNAAIGVAVGLGVVETGAAANLGKRVGRKCRVKCKTLRTLQSPMESEEVASKARMALLVTRPWRWALL